MDTWQVRLSRWIAQHLPERVVYWAVIRSASVIQGDEIVPEVPIITILKRWSTRLDG